MAGVLAEGGELAGARTESDWLAGRLWSKVTSKSLRGVDRSGFSGWGGAGSGGWWSR